MKFFIWYLLSREHSLLLWQLHKLISLDLMLLTGLFLCIFMILLLCFCIIDFMLGIQLYDILQLFLLIIWLSLLLSLKIFSINFMNNLPILVITTDWQSGGLKNMSFLLRFRIFLHCEFLFSVYFSLCLN